jgi:hypothetical protein
MCPSPSSSPVVNFVFDFLVSDGSGYEPKFRYDGDAYERMVFEAELLQQ